MFSTEARIVRVRSETIEKVNGRRNDGAQFRHQRLDSVDGIDDIRAGLPGNNHHDPALAVDVRAVADILYALRHLGNIAQTDRRAILVRNNQWQVFVSGLSNWSVSEMTHRLLLIFHVAPWANWRWRTAARCALAQGRFDSWPAPGDSGPRGPRASRLRQ